MPEVEGERFAYTDTGKRAATKKKEALKKKKAKSKKKKPASKKKKAAPKKNAYRTGGLKASDDLTKKQAKWDRDKAWLIKNIPPGSRQKQMIKVQIGTRPTAKTTK